MIQYFSGSKPQENGYTEGYTVYHIQIQFTSHFAQPSIKYILEQKETNVENIRNNNGKDAGHEENEDVKNNFLTKMLNVPLKILNVLPRN